MSGAALLGVRGIESEDLAEEDLGGRLGDRLEELPGDQPEDLLVAEEAAAVAALGPPW